MAVPRANFFLALTNQRRERVWIGRKQGCHVGLLWPHFKLVGLTKFVWPFCAESFLRRKNTTIPFLRQHIRKMFVTTAILDLRSHSYVGKISGILDSKKSFCVITGNITTV